MILYYLVYFLVNTFDRLIHTWSTYCLWTANLYIICLFIMPERQDAACLTSIVENTSRTRVDNANNLASEFKKKSFALSLIHCANKSRSA